MNIPLPTEIRFACPKCNRPMVGGRELLAEIITCPDCGEAFMPCPRVAEPKPAPTPTPVVKKTNDADKAPSRADQIRELADTWRGWSMVFSFAGGIVIFASIIIGTSLQSTPWPGVALAAALFGGAFWAYLVSQIIHIRANTEK